MADRKLLFQQLADARRRVNESEDRLAAQTRLVAALESDGKDAASARETLAALREAHALAVETLQAAREQLSFR